MVHMRSRWRALLGLLCVALILLGATLAVAHTHERGLVSHADCSLCMAAHHVVPMAASAPGLPVPQVFATVHYLVAASRSKQRLRLTLPIRPPPAAAVHE